MSRNKRIKKRKPVPKLMLNPLAVQVGRCPVCGVQQMRKYLVKEDGKVPECGHCKQVGLC